MKKTIIALLCVIICLTFFGCGADSLDLQTNPPESPTLPDTPQTPTAPNTPDVPTAPIAPPNSELGMQISIGKNIFNILLDDNNTAKEFANMMPLTLNMSELNGNEKYFYLSQNLPVNSQKIGKIKAGDIMLYGSNCLVLFYESFSSSFSYTKIGRIENVAGLKKALGKGSIVVEYDMRK